MLPCLEESTVGVVLKLQVLPRSSRNQLVGLQGDYLKVKLTAPPVDGSANKSCCEYLAKLLGVTKPQVSIVSGTSSRKKRVLVSGVCINDVHQLLDGLIS